MNKVFSVIKNIFAGLYSLCMDPAGTLCLLSLVLVGFLALHSKMGDVAAAACFTMIPAVAVLMKHKSFSGADIDTPPPQQSVVTTIVNDVKGQL
jgi:hypothetical protein